MVAGGWGWAGQGGKNQLQRGTKTILVAMDILSTSIVGMVPWV